jgi:hypothetical protein
MFQRENHFINKSIQKPRRLNMKCIPAVNRTNRNSKWKVGFRAREVRSVQKQLRTVLLTEWKAAFAHVQLFNYIPIKNKQLGCVREHDPCLTITQKVVRKSKTLRMSHHYIKSTYRSRSLGVSLDLCSWIEETYLVTPMLKKCWNKCVPLMDHMLKNKILLFSQLFSFIAR